MNQLMYLNSETLNRLLQKFYALNNLKSDSSYSQYETVAKKYIEVSSKEDFETIKKNIIDIDSLHCPENQKYEILLGFDNLRSTILNVLDEHKPLFLNFTGFKRLICPPLEVFDYHGFSGKVHIPKGF